MSVFGTALEAARGIRSDLQDHDREESAEQADQRAADEAGGMFPNLDHGTRALTERVYEGPGNVRENVVEAAVPGDMSREQIGNVWGAVQNEREENRNRDEENIVRTWGQDFAEGEVGSMFNIYTGLDFETGERKATGVDDVTTPFWYVTGPAGRVGSAGARGAANMAGKSGTSARGSMKSASTYMPERLRNIASAPARTNAAKGVKGATGSAVKSGGSAASSAANFVDSVPLGRTLATVGGVGAATGALGNTLSGDVRAIPNDATNLQVISEMQDPFCLIFEVRKDEDALGYAAVLSVQPEDFEEEPDSAMVIKGSGNGVRATREQWPPSTEFGSPKEARTAYDQLNRQTNDPASPSQGNMDSGPYDEPQGTWAQPQHESALDGGWHLYSQDHEADSDRRRYIVAGYRRDGTLLYLDGEIHAHESFAAFKERGEATTTVQEWLKRLGNGRVPESMKPDPSADRPHPSDVGGEDATGVLGTRVRNSTLVKGAVALAGLIVGLVLLGGRT